jgi:hypothetical protein
MRNNYIIGEYITEMLVWADQDWVYGLQFVMNTGRCSLHYGGASGIPTIATDQGGALVGFCSRVRKHDRWGDLLSRVQASDNAITIASVAENLNRGFGAMIL